MSTITLRLSAPLPAGGRECCRSRLVAALCARDGVLDAHPEAGALLVEIDPGRIAAGDCERLARDAGELIARRYEHQTLAVMADPRSAAALEAADVALLADDLDQLPFAVRLSRSARRIITQDVVFALAIKALFLGAALLGVATLWMAVLADTGAALIVILNGMRLLREK